MTEPFRQVEVVHAGTRVVVVPALGGKIASLFLGGREWLWTSDVLPWRAPVVGTSYVETADTGGWDECFPTVGPCTLPESGALAAHAWSGLKLPDHGELWSQEAEVDVDTRGRTITCRWQARLLPARFERTLHLRDDGAIELVYAVTNDADAPVPFLWSAHPLLPLGDDTRLELPRGARVRAWAAHGIEPVAVGDAVDEADVHRWPFVQLKDGRTVDVSRPARALDGAPFAMKLFLDIPTERAACAVAVHEAGGAALRMTWDPTLIPSFGLWINHRGWTPFAGGRPYLNFAFEPCIGTGDTLTAALGAWRSAHWLDAGAQRRWAVVVDADVGGAP